MQVENNANSFEAIVARIKGNEVSDVKAGTRAWYEVVIALRFDGEVCEHRYPIVCAASHKHACQIGRAIAKVDCGDAVFARARRLAYRGDMHPDVAEYEVRNAGYARCR